ncbi:MAG TPA: hypothetical protein VGN37_11330 [Actinocatenispora sp.]
MLLVTATPPNGLPELLAAWTVLRAVARDGRRCVSVLAALTGLPYAELDHLRRVRNACAHPVGCRWPSQDDVDRALRTAGAALGRCGRGGTTVPAGGGQAAVPYGR